MQGHALVHGSARLRSNNKHDEHALVQGLVVATLGVVNGSEHEDHALVVEARGSGSLPASPRATAAVRLPTEPGRDERRKGCAVGRRGTVLAWCVLARPGPWLSRRSGSLPRPMPFVAARQ